MGLTTNGLPYMDASDALGSVNDHIEALAEALDPSIPRSFVHWMTVPPNDEGDIWGTFATGASHDLASAAAIGSGFDYQVMGPYLDDSGSGFTYDGPDWWFRIAASACWDNADTDGIRRIAINRNTLMVARTQVNAGADQIALSTSIDLKLVSGDNVVAQIFQNSGSSLGMHAPASFSMHAIRPVIL